MLVNTVVNMWARKKVASNLSGWITARCFKLQTEMESEFWSVQCFPISERASLFLQVPRLSPLAFVIREVVRWSWVYDIGGFIPKRQNGSTGRKTCPITTFLAIELTWTGLGSNQGFHGGRPATKRFLIYFFPLCPCTFPYLFLCLFCIAHNPNIYAAGRIRTRNPSKRAVPGLHFTASVSLDSNQGFPGGRPGTKRLGHVTSVKQTVHHRSITIYFVPKRKHRVSTYYNDRAVNAV